MPPEIAEFSGTGTCPTEVGSAAPAIVGPMWQREREIIEEALRIHDGSVTRAAAALEINPSTIYRKRIGWKQEALA